MYSLLVYTYMQKITHQQPLLHLRACRRKIVIICGYLPILLTLAPFYPPGTTKSSQKGLLLFRRFHKKDTKRFFVVGGNIGFLWGKRTLLVTIHKKGGMHPSFPKNSRKIPRCIREPTAVKGCVDGYWSGFMSSVSLVQLWTSGWMAWRFLQFFRSITADDYRPSTSREESVKNAQSRMHVATMASPQGWMQHHKKHEPCQKVALITVEVWRGIENVSLVWQCLVLKLVFSWYVEVSVEYEGVLQLTTKGNLLRACIVATEAVGHFCLMEDACRKKCHRGGA